MADRDHPNVDQVFGGQLRQHLGIDIIIAECLHISLKAQILQPRRDVHAVLLGSESGNPASTMLSLCLPAYQLQCSGVADGILDPPNEISERNSGASNPV